MKFNETYEQKISLIDTINETNNMNKRIIAFFQKRFDLTKIMVPSLEIENSELTLKNESLTRNASFDLGNTGKIVTALINPSNWSRLLLKKLKVKENSGIYYYSHEIKRDIIENTHTTPSNHFLTFQIKVSEDNKKEIFDDITFGIYDIIISLVNEVAKKYNLNRTYEKHHNIVTAQQMENELPSLSPTLREIEFANNLSSFIFLNPGSYMFSGHRHEIVYPQLYDLKSFLYLAFKDEINSDLIKPCSISYLAFGNQLADQLNLYGVNYFSEEDFYNDLINSNDLILEIKINIPQLAIVIMQKGHIAEVQPDVFSDEKSILISRHKIESY